MITLYHGSGSEDFEVHGNALDESKHESLMLNARQILRVRGEDIAIEYLEQATFRVWKGTNHFNDEFYVLLAHVPLQEYEKFRILSNQPEARRAFHQIAEVLTEIGPYIRFIAVGLKHMSPESWDVFICHTREDKVNIAEQLYKHLDSVGIRCWYDSGEILWGDSIIGKINEGLKCSRFVIVVISPVFLRKPWPTKEMNAALSQEIDSGMTRVLPLMVGSDEEIHQMINELAIQRDKKYLRWSENPQEISEKLQVLIRRENVREKAWISEESAQSSVEISDGSLLLTADECAKVLRVKTQTVIDLLESGNLIGLSVNKEWRVTSQQLLDFLHEQTKVKQIEVLTNQLSDPKVWVKELVKYPELKRDIETRNYPKNTFGRFLKDALSSINQDESKQHTGR